MVHYEDAVMHLGASPRHHPDPWIETELLLAVSNHAEQGLAGLRWLAAGSDPQPLRGRQDPQFRARSGERQDESVIFRVVEVRIYDRD